MNVVNVLQGSSEWLLWRKTGVTATDAPVLVDRSPYKTRWRLWAEKTGYVAEQHPSLNPLVRHGANYEDQARQAFEDRYQDLLLPLCIESTEYPIFKASLDGMTHKGEPVELKCPSASVWKALCEQAEQSAAYQHYYAQVQFQLLVAGAEQGWLVFWYEGDIRSFVIARDEVLIQALVEAAQAFWVQVSGLSEPEKDLERDVFIPKEAKARQWIAAAEAYKYLDEQIKQLKSQLEDLQSQQTPFLDELKQLMEGYYHADYAGVMITRYKVSGRVNYNVSSG